MPEDPKEALEKKAHPKCASVWETYKKCEVRIEKKGSGDCAGYYVRRHCPTPSPHPPFILQLVLPWPMQLLPAWNAPPLPTHWFHPPSRSLLAVFADGLLPLPR